MNDITGATGQNEANAKMAQQQQNWTTQNMATAYGYDQAAWQNQMQASNTAHQREIQDMQAAGINPIISATGGTGANTPKMDTPGAMAGPSGNQGMKAGSIMDLVSTVLGGISSAKQWDVATEQSHNLMENTQKQTLDNKIKEETLKERRDAAKAELKEETLKERRDTAKAELKEAKSESERNTYYNYKDLESPNMNYWLNKVNGGGAGSALKVMQIMKMLVD
jgi:hypothetical protein